jgi:hypothetical protein
MFWHDIASELHRERRRLQCSAFDMGSLRMSRLALWIWALLLALLATASPTATADWLEARTQKFIAYSEGNEKSIRSFVEKLERFDQVLQLATGIKTQPGGVPLKVYLVRNPTVVRSLFMSHGKSQDWRTPTGPVFADR